MSDVTPPRWLLLAHQLPTRPSNARVKTWRRLQQIGAVPARNSVYVLPNTEQCREDFEWLRSEIVASRGEATVFAADALNRDGEEDLVVTFQRTREADYRALKRDADKMRSSARAKRTVSAPGRDAWSRAVRTLRERFNEIERIDFFHAAARREAVEALAALERELGDAMQRPAHLDAPRLSAGDFEDRRWVTRPRPGVDRMASAWLIRRFIDPKATFAFVEQPAESDVPFDMYAGDFSHHGTLCTFETLAQRFGLTDDAAVRIGQIVHDLDMKETRYAAPEAPAVDRLVDGLRQMHTDDGVLLQHGIELFEALARSFSSTAATTPRAVRPRKASTRNVSKRRRR